MATDHRGNQLHAGKRTAQEMGWNARIVEHPYTTDDTFTANKWDRTDTDLLQVRSGPEDMGHFKWSVSMPTYGPAGSNVPSDIDGPVDLGRGKSAKTSYGDSKYGNVDRRIVSGKVKTPARAMIASEAMQKRIKEGRDLKTGRPKE